jgi:undecaprenyl-diphosphatase
MFENLFNSVLLGFIQGITEFIPISSSGHLIILRDILDIQISNGFAYDAVLQLTTTLAIFVYFRKDFVKLLKDLYKFVCKQTLEKDDKRMVQAIIWGTIPAVFLGLLLEGLMETVFRSSMYVAAGLIIGALIMIMAENYYLKLDSIKSINKKTGLKIGFFQALALIPGMSRSGMTISGGLFNKINREDAIRFSFLLAFPILFGSGLKKLFELIGTGEIIGLGFGLLLGSIVAFLVGLFAIHFLISFLKKNTLRAFAYYRIFLAALIIALYIV